MGFTPFQTIRECPQDFNKILNNLVSGGSAAVQTLITAQWLTKQLTDGRTGSSSSSSSCMTLTTMGAWDEGIYKTNKEVMNKLWNEIADLADFDKDGEVTTDEFIKALRTTCIGKAYDGLPACLKTFIGAMFKTIDIDGDGNIGIEEYRQDCVKRMAYSNIADLDAAYAKLAKDAPDGITLGKYQELYAGFIANENGAGADIPCLYLFGPLTEIN